MRLKSVPLSFCLTEAQNCLFIGVFIIRMSSAKSGKTSKKAPSYSFTLMSHRQQEVFNTFECHQAPLP